MTRILRAGEELLHLSFITTFLHISISTVLCFHHAWRKSVSSFTWETHHVLHILKYIGLTDGYWRRVLGCVEMFCSKRIIYLPFFICSHDMHRTKVTQHLRSLLVVSSSFSWDHLSCSYVSLLLTAFGMRWDIKWCCIGVLRTTKIPSVSSL